MISGWQLNGETKMLQILNLWKDWKVFSSFDAMVYFRLVKFYEKRFDYQYLITISLFRRV